MLVALPARGSGFVALFGSAIASPQVCLDTDQVLASLLTRPACTVFSLDQTASRRASGRWPLVGSNGLEPSTSRLSGVRSNHLSYEPISVAGRFHRPNLCFGSALATLRDRCPPSRSDCSASWLRCFTAGGDEQNRTVDPLLARQVLSQLSYAPISGLYHSGESTL